MVFQDPGGSLNPRMTVGRLIAEPLEIHRIGNRSSRRQQVLKTLEAVGLSAEDAQRYPHQFSGGQRQRIAIARAIAIRPALILADEPVSALDVSLQAQILNLIDSLRRRLGLALLFVSHDLNVVRHLCGRVAVMYHGRIVESGPTSDVFDAPCHPYTRELVACSPIPRPDAARAAPHPYLGTARPGRASRWMPLSPPMPACPRHLQNRGAGLFISRRPAPSCLPFRRETARTRAGAAMRLFVASLATETNTFSPVFTDLRDFRDSFYYPPGQHPEIPSLCSAPFIALREFRSQAGFPLDIAEGTAAWAEPGGIVSGDAYLYLRDEILAQMKQAMPLDGVLFGLHGAMVAQGFDDCEGDLLTSARRIIGDKAIMGATFDPHCHFTQQCADALDAAITFKEFPHTDMMHRARELVDIITRAVDGQIKPCISSFDCRMIDIFPTTEASIRKFVDRISALSKNCHLCFDLNRAWIHGWRCSGNGNENSCRHRQRSRGWRRSGPGARPAAP